MRAGVIGRVFTVRAASQASSGSRTRGQATVGEHGVAHRRDGGVQRGGPRRCVDGVGQALHFDMDREHRLRLPGTGMKVCRSVRHQASDTAVCCQRRAIDARRVRMQPRLVGDVPDEALPALGAA